MEIIKQDVRTRAARRARRAASKAVATGGGNPALAQEVVAAAAMAATKAVVEAVRGTRIQATTLRVSDLAAVAAGAVQGLTSPLRGERRPVEAGRDPRLPAIGTVLIRRDEAGRIRARCTIAKAGYVYKGKRYGSLSSAANAAARDMGGYSPRTMQNGFLFWGLDRRIR